ncbi:hypothetical protein [Helicobacter sp. 13S00482-2]|uniref:hypothetical protein n=1 Tax=Helicobacter sp. 13S00482-2 TaxID=1476200 RepID=UPI0015DB41EC|nr:hypothetical protein [Helicobacter sp. 13S00482-2]
MWFEHKNHNHLETFKKWKNGGGVFGEKNNHLKLNISDGIQIRSFFERKQQVSKR